MSCLFHSLSAFVSHHDYRKLRQDICNYLESNQPLLDDLTIKEIAELEGLSKEQYIENMRSDNTWGGAINAVSYIEYTPIGSENKSSGPSLNGVRSWSAATAVTIFLGAFMML